jgi:HD-GYP domain-containing protein (c-di-GMP phosphodiesterase class II)
VSPSLGQVDRLTPPRSLDERCRILGLPLWRLDGRGGLVSAPKGWGLAEPWLRSPRLRKLIDRAAATEPAGTKPTVVELFPGGWAMIIAERQTAIGWRRVVVLVLSPQALDCQEFVAACDSAQLNPDLTRSALGPLVRYRQTDLDHLSTIVDWMLEDLRQTAEDSVAINQFSEQLVHGYEQISLLYRLGRSMSYLTDPGQFLEMTTGLLHATLDYQWLTVKLAPVHVQELGIRSGTVLVGTLPCPQAKFDELTSDLIEQMSKDQWTVVLNERRSELAALVGSLVVADPITCGGRVAGVIAAGNKTGPDRDVSSVDTQLLAAVADYLGAYLHNVALFNEQRSMFFGTIHALTAAIDAKDRYTRGHSERVAAMASRLALASGMTEEHAERVRIAGLVHDVGKIGVPEAVLQKPGRLTEAEFEQIKQHPTIGHKILEDIEALDDVLPGVLYHHERWDGRGYPEGLDGHGIPLLGRLLGVADAFDAMSSDRSYRPALPREKVLGEIRANAGSQFDPDLAEVFLTLDLAEYDALVSRHRSLDAEAA